jgi:hypothetical protein
MAGSQGREALGGSCCIHSETETEGGKLNTLLTQSDLVTLELDQRLERARTSEAKVPGFGSLSKLEQEQARIASELANAKRDVADRQRALERAIIEQQKTLERIQTGDQLFTDFTGQIEYGAVDFITSKLERTPEAESRMIQGMAQLSPRREFCQHWPAAKKIFEKRAKELDRSIKNLMEKGGKE